MRRNWHPNQVAYWKDQMRKREAAHKLPLTVAPCHACGIPTTTWNCHICNVANDTIYRDWNCMMLLGQGGGMG